LLRRYGSQQKSAEGGQELQFFQLLLLISSNIHQF
jgi:hypothetical protein